MLDCEFDETMPYPINATYYFYKICCKDPEIKTCYIGKTKNFESRMSCHKSHSKSSGIKLYRFIQENGEWDNFNMIIIHKCICDDTVSNYIETALIKQYKMLGIELLNIHIPNNYINQEYNKLKCKEHYAIQKECECGWIGSKMEWAHHKQSKKHTKYCIAKFEAEIMNAI